QLGRILLVAAHLLVAATTHGGQRRTAITIALGGGAGNRQATASLRVVGPTGRTPGLGAAGATGIFQFRLGARTVLRCARTDLAAIGLARRCGWHIANRGHAGTGTTLAGRTTGCACGA